VTPAASPSFELVAGTAPLLVSFPHSGIEVPAEIEARLTPAARALPDTDWHLPRLYDFVDAFGASTLTARLSRYVIDLNRSPDDASLYPGQATTGLVPLESFAGAPLYRDGAAPDAAETAARRTVYWEPYHTALGAELERLRQRHGLVVLWDAHSITSYVPRFFAGRLPDLNLGTAGGTSCAPHLQGALTGLLAAQDARSHVVNGRFKGGYITRQYGRPDAGVHAVQLEMCCSTYMEETPPWIWDPARARGIRPLLRTLIEAAVHWATGQRATGQRATGQRS
jgi:N-formylglutamate deformylase